MAATSSLLDLIERSSFVFAGTVTSLGPSPLRVLTPLHGLAVVDFERGFLTNPILGSLVGRPITVQLAQTPAVSNASVVKQRLIFFATAWVHGEEIAVTEIARIPDTEDNETEVARIVESLPQRHLSERIASAVVVVHGKVTEIVRATEVSRTGSEHDPYWMRATIEVFDTLKGQSAAKTDKNTRLALFFPGSGDIAFRKVPRPSVNQEAVFLLHVGPAVLPKSAYVGPDPVDIQPPSQLQTIRQLLGLT